MNRAEWEARCLEDREDERLWLEERAVWERQRAEDLALDVDELRADTRRMIDRWAAERAVVEAQSAVEFERAREGWRVSYPRENVA